MKYIYHGNNKKNTGNLYIIGAGYVLTVSVMAFNIAHHKNVSTNLLLELNQVKQSPIIEVVKPVEPTVVTYEKRVIPVEEKKSYNLSTKERELVEKIVACEVGADDFEGQLAVAQCVMNSVLIDNTDVFEVFDDYQYRLYPREVTDENKLAVEMVFDYGATVTDLPIQWFVTPEVAPNSWHQLNMTKAGQYGVHYFYYDKDLVEIS